MATYRQIHTTFWQDDFILGLKVKEKFFYLWLLTNPKVNQSGCYEISKKIAELETGFNWEKEIEPLLAKFKSNNKIDYDSSTNEILIMKWLKYNGSASPKIYKNIMDNIQNIKSAKFKEYCANTISILYQYPIELEKYSMDTETQEKNKNNNKNNNKNREKNTHACAREELSLSQIKFKNAFPNKNIDTDLDVNQNVDLLIKGINDSEFLRNCDNLSLSWFKSHYDEIIKGKFKDFKKEKQKVFKNERSYSQEECEQFFTDITNVQI